MNEMNSFTTATYTNATEISTTVIIDNFTTFENITDEPGNPAIPPPNFGGPPPRTITVETWLVPLVLGLVTVIGVVGNSVVIFVVFKNGKMHTVTNFYIVNLAATDISFLVFVVPFTASLYATYFGTWIWGSFMCKFVNYMQLVTAQATCLTLTAMSVDRYQAIVHPLKSLRTRTTKVAAIISASIWTFSILVSIPSLIYHGLLTFGPYEFCLERWPSHIYQSMYVGYVVYIFVVIYAVPLMIISLCYANMLRRLWMQVVPDAATNAQAQARHARQKRKITYMVLVVVVVFMLCWLPFHTINLWSRIGKDYPRTKVGHAFQVFAKVLAYSNSCLNPFVYAFMGENFRKYFKKACPCCYSNKVGPDLSSGEGRSVIHERTVGGTLHENVPP